MVQLESLFLPKGSVRAIIALVLVLPMSIAMFYQVKIPEGMYALAGMAVTWYFRKADDLSKK